MAWLTTCDSTNEIVKGKRVIVTFRTVGWIGLKDTTTVITTHFVGVDRTTADAYVDAHAADANVEDIYSEQENDAGAYRVVVVTRTTVTVLA